MWLPPWIIIAIIKTYCLSQPAPLCFHLRKNHVGIAAGDQLDPSANHVMFAILCSCALCCLIGVQPTTEATYVTKPFRRINMIPQAPLLSLLAPRTVSLANHVGNH